MRRQLAAAARAGVSTVAPEAMGRLRFCPQSCRLRPESSSLTDWTSPHTYVTRRY